VRKVGQEWEVVNLGANGTYIDGKRITKTPAMDGMIMRLASSGPKILIKIESSSANQPHSNDANSQLETGRGMQRKRITKDTLIGED
jgi:hypothetical protein